MARLLDGTPVADRTVSLGEEQPSPAAPRLVVDNAAARRGAAAPLVRAGLPAEFARLVEVHGAAALRAAARTTPPRPALAVDNGPDGVPRAGETWWWDWAEAE